VSCATDGKNRVRPSTAIYRALMIAVEARRLELELSMATVNDLAGLQDGFFSRMIYPDTPSGRQARWETVDLAMEALFGRGYTITIQPGEMRMPSMPRIDKGASSNALQVRHWRHRKHFQTLGQLGAMALHAKRTPEQRSKAARRAAKKRWRAVRQGLAHKKRNEEARA